MPRPRTTTIGQSSLGSRLAAAWAMPWHHSYTCPLLRRIDGTIAALLGFEPYWSTPTNDEEGYRNPSALSYRVFKLNEHDQWCHSHGVEVPTYFPQWAIRAECQTRNAAWRARARLHAMGWT